MQQCVMVSASSDKPAIEFERMAFKDELKRSVLFDINCQADDTPEYRTADGYKTHWIILINVCNLTDVMQFTLCVSSVNV